MGKRLIISIAIMMLVSGCSSWCSPGIKPRNVEQYYIPTGIEKYFLPGIPDWANFSSAAKCFRVQNLRYFDIDALMKSYALKFNEALQIQATYNDEYLRMKKNDVALILSLKDEESLFFRSSEKVGSKIIFFEPPAFKQIHLIWLDEALAGKKEEERLREFLHSAVHDNGVPVLVSACLTKAEIEAKFPDAASMSISSELFSIYDEKGVRHPVLQLNMNTFFKADQKLIFYQQSKRSPEDIRGDFKVLNY